MKKLIGRKERVTFPEIGLQAVLAKIDTGAYSSSLHCVSYKEKSEGGVSKLKVVFLGADGEKIHHTFDTFEKTSVRSSSGVAQERYLVRLQIKIGKKSYKTAVTLANRSKMKCPVLLGRKLLNKRFIVDVSEQYILSV